MTEDQIKLNAEAYADKVYSNTCEHELSNLNRAVTVHDFIAGAHSRDEEIAELEEQHEEDRLYVEEAQKSLKFWREFINYLNDKAIGDKNKIIEAVVNDDLNLFEGYVKVTKTIDNDQKIMLEFYVKGKGKYRAEWQPSDNYACWQTCGISGDDFSGYLLFPTYKDDEYFCMYYTC